MASNAVADCGVYRGSDRPAPTSTETEVARRYRDHEKQALQNDDRRLVSNRSNRVKKRNFLETLNDEDEAIEVE